MPRAFPRRVPVGIYCSPEMVIRALLVTLATLAALLVAGCGSTDDETAATTGTVPIVAVQNYGQWIEAIRDLKRRKICNVAMRDGAPELPMIVLCGESLGDAGFAGTLPPDKPVRVTRDWPGRR